MNRVIVLLLALALAFVFSDNASAAKKPAYEGYKKCGGCHRSQKESWLKTKHAKAFKSLKPGKDVKAKKLAKLDPKKDYTKDKDCVGCHVTGYRGNKGYSPKMTKTKAKYYNKVGCETCHGPGSLYRKDHSKSGKKFKTTKKASPRKPLLKMGEILVDYEEACNKCHMNYEGSPWKGAKEPYTPFTPDLDKKKYTFNYEEAIKDDKAMHEHFKLRGVYKGEPIFKMREEFQKTAKEPAAPEEEEGGGK